jgi:L-fuculose-phosphate aldolase
LAARLDTGNWTYKEKVVLTCRMLAMENHSETLAGQITVRCDDDTYLTTPLAVAFDEVEPRHVMRVDASLRVLEGDGMPNPAVRFICGCIVGGLTCGASCIRIRLTYPRFP